MQTTPTPVRHAFHQLLDPRELACGVTAHLVDPSNIDRGQAFRLDRHDRVTSARHTGWHADATQFETLTGVVCAFAPDVDGDDEPVTTYYALVVSDDTDCHYLDPVAYDDAVAAGHAADRAWPNSLPASISSAASCAIRQSMRVAASPMPTGRAARRSASCATPAAAAPQTVIPWDPPSTGSGPCPSPAGVTRSD